MADLVFTKATKTQAKLRLALDGPSGSGKTYTALTAATAMANGGKIAVIDTERGSASLYSDKFNFDVLELNTFSPEIYTKAIEAAEEAGYSVIVIDCSRMLGKAKVAPWIWLMPQHPGVEVRTVTSLGEK